MAIHKTNSGSDAASGSQRRGAGLHSGAAGNQAPTLNLIKSTQRRAQLEDNDRFVLYNTGCMSIPAIWAELKAILNPEMYKGIISLKKISSKHSAWHIEMMVKKEVGSGLKRTISSMTRERTPKFVKATKGDLDPSVKWRSRAVSLWRIDLWRSWRDRKVNSNGKKQTSPAVNSRTARIMTLNLNGFKSKAIELEQLLCKEKIKVCAIQETLVTDRAHQLRVPGYTTYAQNWTTGFRGQAVLVHQSLSSYLVEQKEGHYIHVKISGLTRNSVPVHVIAIYLPSGGNFVRERRKRIREILAINKRVLTHTPGAPIIILGDWNMSAAQIGQEINPPITGLQVLQTRGSPLSRFPVNGAPKSLDHIVVSASGRIHLRRPRVHRDYPISDHRPVIAEFRAIALEAPSKINRMRFDTDAIKGKGRSIVNHNKWSALSVEEASDEEELNTRTNAFISTMDKVCKKLEVKRALGSHKPRFPRKLASMYKRRNTLAKKLAKMATEGKVTAEVRESYLKATKTFEMAHKKWATTEERKAVKHTLTDLRAGDLKKVWTRLMSSIEHDRNASALPLVRNAKGELCVTPEAILEAIADHYDALANADPGPSQDEDHWADVEVGGDRQPELQGLNEPLTWKQVLLSIRNMERNTSTGDDETHVNVLKEMLKEECMQKVLMDSPGMRRPELINFALGEIELPEVPYTKMGKAFLPILKSIWAQGVVPEEWKEAEVCSLYKSGDPELMANYRGISLISVGFKVLLGVMANRLSTGLEKAKLFVREQAGFRAGEEAVAQYIAVAEMVRRRHIVGKSTYAIFIDFKKAFDRVHHEALYKILDHMGVRGQFLTLIKAMYRTSRIHVSAGGHRTRTFGMARGTRQGCPLSPILFIIFVNNLLRETTCGGITVPGLSVANKCPGGKYADDVVGLEETDEKAQRFCNNVREWGVKWGMEMGLAKCGVMLITGDEELDERHRQNVYDTPEGPLPIVDEYKYLGITMQKSVGDSRGKDGNELAFVKLQAAKGEKVLNVIRPLLRDPKWPMSIKATVIRTILMSKMLYGSEWVGYKLAHAVPIQRIVNKALKLAMGSSSKSRQYDCYSLGYELGLPSIAEEQNALRARLSAKLQYSDGIKTWLKELSQHPYRAAKKTWITTNQKYEKELLRGLTKHDGEPLRPWVARGRAYELHTRCNDYRNEALDQLRNTRNEVDNRGFEVEDEPAGVTRTVAGYRPTRYDSSLERQLQQTMLMGIRTKTPDEWQHISDMKDCMLERNMTAQRSPAWQFYDKFGIGATRGYLRNALSRPDLNKGVNWLIRVRTRSFPRVNDRWQVLSRTGAPPFERDHCPLCGDKVIHGWEWEHLVMSCDHIEVGKARAKYLKKSIELLKDQLQLAPYVRPDDEDDFFQDRVQYEDDISLTRAIGIYIVGGVHINNFDVDYHRGFGQLDELPEGLDSFGYTFIAEFLAEVAPIWVGSLFPEGDPYYSVQDEFASLYSPKGDSLGELTPQTVWSNVSAFLSP
ncbi:LINE-1 retrotransposable element ORF2 protein [Sparassis crispa]|uniref:LINE-1 retrotransposable element ORF2 protein n=1 Tax=Sparassis crispa TaxID=139825 RepID=A0A401H027_9APHY|nr:LINE-1 retrotransposable element ORF2 protein [Sparassis crispa]GBE87773.1 LINE-1 retrotransposable element ORF2 protein [Sparassis crispa]